MSIPVERAETFYLPPPTMPPDAWDAVPAAERVFLWVSYRINRTTRPPKGFVIGHVIWPRINHNRWLADCACSSAQVVSPSDPRMSCTECGLGWVSLVFPEDPATVEASLAELLPHERNWWHDEDPARPEPPVEEPPTEPTPEES